MTNETDPADVNPNPDAPGYVVPDPVPPPTAEDVAREQNLGDGPQSHDTSPLEVPDPRGEWEDGPQSHDTAGDSPADDVRATHGEPPDPVGDGPSSHDTAGISPADDVAATHDAE